MLFSTEMTSIGYCNLVCFYINPFSLLYSQRYTCLYLWCQCLHLLHCIFSAYNIMILITSATPWNGDSANVYIKITSYLGYMITCSWHHVVISSHVIVSYPYSYILQLISYPATYWSWIKYCTGRLLKCSSYCLQYKYLWVTVVCVHKTGVKEAVSDWWGTEFPKLCLIAA